MSSKTLPLLAPLGRQKINQRVASPIWRRALLMLVLCVLNAPGLAWGQAIPEISAKDAASRLAAGGYILLMRHSKTTPGFGDPENFQLSNCDTQRNLSAVGRAHAIALGQAFKAASIELSGVQHSQWCRCRDTALLAFGQASPLPALNSTFGGQGDSVAQMAQLKSLAAALPPEQNVIWVTHQVIVSAATGSWTKQGDILATRFIDGQFRVQFRIPSDG